MSAEILLKAIFCPTFVIILFLCLFHLSFTCFLLSLYTSKFRLSNLGSLNYGEGVKSENYPNASYFEISSFEIKNTFSQLFNYKDVTYTFGKLFSQLIVRSVSYASLLE